jgi:hypothetical protein
MGIARTGAAWPATRQSSITTVVFSSRRRANPCATCAEDRRIPGCLLATASERSRAA